MLTLPQTKTHAEDAFWPRRMLPMGLAVFSLSLVALFLLFYTFPNNYDSFFFSLDPRGMQQFRAHLGLEGLPHLGFRAFSRAYRLLLVLLWGGYALTLFACLRGARLSMRAVLAAIVLAGVVTAVFAPPLLSSDVYANISHGRIFVLYGHNPYLWLPRGLGAVHDPVEPFLVWDVPTVYGPVWTWIEVGVVALFRSAGVWTQVVALKLLLAGALLVTALAGRRLAARLSPGRENLVFLAIGLNPLLLLEGPGTAHNDLAFFSLLMVGVMFYFDKKYVAAALCLGLSVGIKPLTLALLPWALLDYSRGRNWRQALTGAVVATALVLLPLALLFIPFWRGTETLAAMQQRSKFQQTHALASHALLVFVYLALSVWLLKWRREGQWLTAWALFSIALMFLLLVPIFPWYIIWFWPICLLRWDRWHPGLSTACLALSLVWMIGYGMISPGKPLQGHWWINMDGTTSPHR